MNTAEKYIYYIYKERSFSEAAKKLFVSQPALSSTVKKHESKLGYKIFNRQTVPVTLTKSGEVYIEYLTELQSLEEQLKNRIKKINRSSSNTLFIGGAKSIAFHIIPKLCRRLYELDPNIKIIIDVDYNRTLLDELDKGKLDIVITTNNIPDEFDSVVIKEEKYMIAVRKDYKDTEKLKKYSLTYDEVLIGKWPKEKEIKDWDLFKNIPFFKPATTSKSSKIFSDFCEKIPGSMCSVLHFKNVDMQYQLMLEGLGAVFVSQSTILDKGYDSNNLYYFVLDVPNNVRQAVIVYKKNAQQKAYVNELIEIARELYLPK